MTSTDVVYAGASLRERQDYALALSKAGELIPRGLRDPNGQPNPGKILLVTEYGNALGIHPIVAINGVDIIEGNLTITPALMSGLVRQAGHKLRISTNGSGTEMTARAVLVRSDDPKHPFDVTWSMADAKAAGLDNKQNWKKYPRAMLKARAISEVCREGAEDVLMGAYTPEEIGATVNEAGEVIEDAEIVEQDHDGPNVTATMREPAPIKAQPKRAEPKPAAPTRAHAEVLTEWASRIGEINELDALIKLHVEAADRHVLDHRDSKGTSIEDVFLARRETILAKDAALAESDTEETNTDLTDQEPF